MTQAVNILMRDIEDENNTSMLTVYEGAEVAVPLQLAVAKKENNIIPKLDKHGRYQAVAQAVESDGRPAGYKQASAHLRLR